MAVASAGLYANNLHLVPDNRTNTPSLNFYSPDALPNLRPNQRRESTIIVSLFFLWREIVKEDSQVHNLNTEDAMDHSKWRKLIKDVR